MIEKAMRDVHFSAHPTRSAKQQVRKKTKNEAAETSRKCFWCLCPPPN